MKLIFLVNMFNESCLTTVWHVLVVNGTDGIQVQKVAVNIFSKQR
jgi:hypothetical protein